jgi:hypothetical protein
LFSSLCLGPFTFTEENDYGQKQISTYSNCDKDSSSDKMNDECKQFRTAGAITFVEALCALCCAGIATLLALLNSLRRTTFTSGTYKCGACASLLSFCAALTW